MRRRQAEGLSVFLKPTFLLDSDNLKIVKKTEELTRNCKIEAEKAKALYEFARDHKTEKTTKSIKASNISENVGNNMSCHRATILLTALCRAAGIPARLHLQRVKIKNWRKPDGTRSIEGSWHLYETVGHKDKWVQWTGDEDHAKEMPVEFHSDRNCLFEPNEKITMETLQDHFATITEEWIELDETLNDM